MRPTFSRSLLLSLSRWQLDGMRNRKGLKDLLLLPFSIKDKHPSDHFPQCSIAWRPLISSYEKAQESDRFNQRRKSITEVSLLFFCLYHLLPPPSFPQPGRSAFAGSIWVHLSQTRQAEGPLCPLGLQGLSVLQCGSLLLWKRRAWACPLACLDHLKSPIHPFPCLARPPAHPTCPEAWLM